MENWRGGGDPGRTAAVTPNQGLILAHPANRTLGTLRGFWGRWLTRPAILIAGLALAFDPHVLLLSWSAERQETVAATSRATCEAARDAIAAGRWLADDPPAAMRCDRGSAFAPGSDCIAGYSCPPRQSR